MDALHPLETGVRTVDSLASVPWDLWICASVESRLTGVTALVRLRDNAR